MRPTCLTSTIRASLLVVMAPALMTRLRTKRGPPPEKCVHSWCVRLVRVRSWCATGCQKRAIERAAVVQSRARARRARIAVGRMHREPREVANCATRHSVGPTAGDGQPLRCGHHACIQTHRQGERRWLHAIHGDHQSRHQRRHPQKICVTTRSRILPRSALSARCPICWWCIRACRVIKRTRGTA